MLSGDPLYWFFSTLAQSDVALIAFLALIYFQALQSIEKKQNNLLDEVSTPFWFSFNFDFISEQKDHPNRNLYVLSSMNKSKIYKNEAKIVTLLWKAIMVDRAGTRYYSDITVSETFNSKFKSYEGIVDAVSKDHIDRIHSQPHEFFINNDAKTKLIEILEDIKSRYESIQTSKTLHNEANRMKIPFEYICYTGLAQFFCSILGLLFVKQSNQLPAIINWLALNLFFLLDVILLLVIIGFSVSFFRRLLKAIHL